MRLSFEAALLLLGAVLLLVLWVGTGCKTAEHAGIAIFYRETRLPAGQVKKDIPYVAGATRPDQQLDLFLPDPNPRTDAGRSYPVVVFVPGGGWTSGHRAERFGGADVYGNIGRYLASQGIGVAVISYRLQPEVGWNDQARDVARAAAWVKEHIANYGGDSNRVFLMGHSAGAQLAAHVALNPLYLRELGLDSGMIRGVVSVSGAGLDLTTAEVQDKRGRMTYYAQRFYSPATSKEWRQLSSPVTYATAQAPPFLIVYTEGESRNLHYQSQRLQQCLEAAGANPTLFVVPGQSHARIVLGLSRGDSAVMPVLKEFLTKTGD